MGGTEGETLDFVREGREEDITLRRTSKQNLQWDRHKPSSSSSSEFQARSGCGLCEYHRLGTKERGSSWKVCRACVWKVWGAILGSSDFVLTPMGSHQRTLSR